MKRPIFHFFIFLWDEHPALYQPYQGIPWVSTHLKVEFTGKTSVYYYYYDYYYVIIIVIIIIVIITIIMKNKCIL